MRNISLFLTIILITILCIPSQVQAQSSTIIISELLYDTPLQEANGTLHPHNGEFISFYNYGNSTVNIGGWQIRIDNTTEYTFFANTTIKPYSILALAYCANGSNFKVDSFYSSFVGNDGQNALLYQSSMILPNRTTHIELYSNTGTLQDEIIYDGDDALPAGVPAMRARNTLNLTRAGNLSVSLQRTNITKNSGNHIFQRSDYKGGSTSSVRLFAFNNPQTLTLTRDGNKNVIKSSNSGYTSIFHDDDIYNISDILGSTNIDLGTFSESEDIPSLKGALGVDGNGAAI
jgi:hypothetical protein